ncbi:MAG: hypothetical protein H6733_11885 [Alphaproteobacteria bacterium]|nr:hypothetical protein [Alphaproteobacteria bacterium]
MHRVLRLTPLLLALACDGGTDGTDKSTDTDTDTTDTTDTETPLTVDAVGDFSCFSPATDWSAVVWAAEQSVKPAGTVTVEGVVNDFEHDEPVGARTVNLWYNDTPTGASSTDGQVDANGNITFGDVPSCQPVSYLVEEVEGANQAKETYKAHQIYGNGTGTTIGEDGSGSGGSLDAEFQSVAISTYRLIPSILGIDQSTSNGVVAGTMYDCARDPDTLPSDDTGKVEGIRVRIFGCPTAISAPEDCTSPVSGVYIAYFTDNFPNRDQPWSSEDGLWGVYNVPPGTFRIDAYGRVGGEEKVLGSTVVTTYADSINIANIWAGVNNGVKYPAACLTE